MKRWIPTWEQLKQLPEQIIKMGSELIFHLGVVFLFLLVLSSILYVSGMVAEELPDLDMALLVKGPLPYIWFGLFGIWIATKVKEWVATAKSLRSKLKAHPEIKARLATKLSRLWDTARGYTS